MNKLYSLQSKIGILSKDTTNEFYKCKYFDINSLIKRLKPLLDEYKIGITQPLEVIDGKNVLATYIVDLEDSGKVLQVSKIALPDINEPQKIGSTITYYRRYSLQTMLFLEAEDDDGNRTRAQPVQRANNLVNTQEQPPHYADSFNTPPAPQPTSGNAVPCSQCGNPETNHKAGTSKAGKPFDLNECPKCEHVTWNN